jgi:hypothetical protein
MTEEEYLRMRNLLDEVIAQQARAEERQAKTDEQLARNAEQIARNTEGIAALLTLAQIHEGEITRTNQEMATQFKRTDDRINALADVVERYITKG